MASEFFGQMRATCQGRRDKPLVIKALCQSESLFSAIVTAAYRYFRDTANLHQGQIAAITSVAGVKALGVATAYSASKCFQQRFINCLEQLAYRRQVNVA